MAKKTEAQIDAEVAAELAAEAALAEAAAVPAIIPATTSEVKRASATGRLVVKLGCHAPFQIIGGDVYTSIDCMRNRAEMYEEPLGVRCFVTVRTRDNTPPKEFFVPWSNITYVVYGQ